MLEAGVGGLEYELHVRDLRLKEKDQRIAELEARVLELKMRAGSPQDATAAPGLPPFVKPNRPKGRRRQRPGRKDGHPAALRPMPKKIDQRQDVPLETDARRRPISP